MVAGFICSLLVPALHGSTAPAPSMKESLWGMVIGGGLIYAIVRLGKLAFGRQKLKLPAGTRVVFTETAIVLPDKEIPFDGLFYRKSDAVKLEASRVELADRCYQGVTVRLTATQLEIGEDAMDPESVPFMEVFTDKLILPREAMGLGDVKFMAAIGAFLGWPAAIFSFFLSAVLGSVVGVALIASKRESWRNRVIPYGPYIAVAAAVWIFGGHRHWDEFWRSVSWR
jgi:leader peptidase (prepilin peptidase) / N-methyltransferase